MLPKWTASQSFSRQAPIKLHTSIWIHKREEKEKNETLKGLIYSLLLKLEIVVTSYFIPFNICSSSLF